jgi:hypothetical protein
VPAAACLALVGIPRADKPPLAPKRSLATQDSIIPIRRHHFRCTDPHAALPGGFGVDGDRQFIKIDPERSIITFFVAFGLRSRVLDSDKLKFANKLNDELVLARFSVPRSDILWCEHQLLYDGGVTAFRIINTYKWFVNVCRRAAQEDKAGIIGTD